MLLYKQNGQRDTWRIGKHIYAPIQPNETLGFRTPNTINQVNKQSLPKRQLKRRALRNKQRYCLQDPPDWTHKLPSTAIMGLILMTLLLAFLLMLDALRNQISIHLNYACTTKQNKEKKRESRQEQIVSKTTWQTVYCHWTNQLEERKRTSRR